MIKLAYNKKNNNLVFAVNKVDRVAVGEAGIKEYYVGVLIDTSTVPDARTENFRFQVKGFESDWTEVPLDVGATNPVNNQEKTVTPAITAFNVTPDSGYSGLSKVKVNAAPLEEKTVTLSTTDTQTIVPSTNKIGLSSVTVPAVTAAIDVNITAGNIKSGVTILGVAGSYVKPDEPNLIAGNIKHGVTIYGVEGTYTGD